MYKAKLVTRVGADGNKFFEIEKFSKLTDNDLRKLNKVEKRLALLKEKFKNFSPPNPAKLAKKFLFKLD